MKRKGISKKIRFEVFKRDSFKCQYCGKSSPDVLLEIDHIKPVSKGGDNEILNLITACVDCNRGKSDRTLDDNAVVTKQKKQLEELAERKEQLEMLMDWKMELVRTKDDAIKKVGDFWSELVPGYQLSENGLNNLRKYVHQFGYDRVIDAMEISTSQYLAFKDDKPTNESVEIAFSKIGGICNLKRKQEDNPNIKDIYYIRGILKNRLSYFDKNKALDLIQNAIDAGADIDSLKKFASSTKNWSSFVAGIEDFIITQKNKEMEAPF